MLLSLFFLSFFSLLSSLSLLLLSSLFLEREE
jgi:hypothetical protein